MSWISELAQSLGKKALSGADRKAARATESAADKAKRLKAVREKQQGRLLKKDIANQKAGMSPEQSKNKIKGRQGKTVAAVKEHKSTSPYTVSRMTKTGEKPTPVTEDKTHRAADKAKITDAVRQKKAADRMTSKPLKENDEARKRRAKAEYKKSNQTIAQAQGQPGTGSRPKPMSGDGAPPRKGFAARTMDELKGKGEFGEKPQPDIDKRKLKHMNEVLGHSHPGRYVQAEHQQTENLFETNRDTNEKRRRLKTGKKASQNLRSKVQNEKASGKSTKEAVDTVKKKYPVRAKLGEAYQSDYKAREPQRSAFRKRVMSGLGDESGSSKAGTAAKVAGGAAATAGGIMAAKNARDKLQQIRNPLDDALK